MNTDILVQLVILGKATREQERELLGQLMKFYNKVVTLVSDIKTIELKAEP